MDTIGLHKIIVPDRKWLHFSDGLELSAQISEDLKRGITNGTAKLAILFPSSASVYEDGEYRRKAEFFIGLLEETIEHVRDAVFPKLRIQANRDKIQAVKTEPKNNNVDDALRAVFHTPWVTYAPLEEFISNKIFVGFQYEDGNFVLSKVDDNGCSKIDIEDKNAYNRLVGFQTKLGMALDTMFFNNLTLRHTLSDTGTNCQAECKP